MDSWKLFSLGTIINTTPFIWAGQLPAIRSARVEAPGDSSGLETPGRYTWETRLSAWCHHKWPGQIWVCGQPCRSCLQCGIKWTTGSCRQQITWTQTPEVVWHSCTGPRTSQEITVRDKAVTGDGSRRKTLTRLNSDHRVKVEGAHLGHQDWCLSPVWRSWVYQWNINGAENPPEEPSRTIPSTPLFNKCWLNKGLYSLVLWAIQEPQLSAQNHLLHQPAVLP